MIDADKSSHNDCLAHMAYVHDVEELQRQTKAQWTCIDSIKNKINVALGGIAVSCIMLAINIILTYSK